MLTGSISVMAMNSPVYEGSQANFKIQGYNLPAGGVTVYYQTTPGTATPGADYMGLSGSIFLPAPAAMVSVNVSTLTDGVNDPGGTFSPTLTSVTGDATINSGSAQMTINQQSGPPPGPNPQYITLQSPGTLNEGQLFALTGQVYPPAVYQLVGSVNWGGFVTASGSTVNFTTNSDGSFLISNIYYDDGTSPGNGTASDVASIGLNVAVNGTQLSASTTASIHNVAPTTLSLETGLEMILLESEIPGGPFLTLHGTIRDPGQSDVHVVSVDWGDGSEPQTLSPTQGSFVFGHNYRTGGTFAVAVEIIDDDLGHYTWTGEAIVDPVAELLAAYLTGWEAQNLDTFLSAQSEYGQIAAYQLDIDMDGTFDYSAANHDPLINGALNFDLALLGLLGSPADDDVYPVELRVLTNAGYFEDFVVEVVIGNMPPAIGMTGDEAAQAGSAYTLEVSTNDPGPDTVTHITIEWGDGSSSVIAGETGILTHVYVTDGSYTVRATATDEDDSYWAETTADIGDVDLPAVPSDNPIVISAESVILANGNAELTIEAVDSSGSTNLTYDWDLNCDGVFELPGSATVEIAPGADFYSYSATVRITDTVGRTTEALFGFLQGGQQTRQSTINTYESDFRKVTPSLPADWKVHHKLQHFGDKLAARFWKEKGINLHNTDNLVGVPDSVHKEINAAQQKFWVQMKKKHGWTPANIPLAEVEQFAAKLEAEFGSRWVNAGASKRTIDKVADLVKNDAVQFALAKGTRWQRLDLDVIEALGILALIQFNNEAMKQMKQFNPNTHPQFIAFMAQYESALGEAIELGYVKHNTAIHLIQAMKVFGVSIKLDGDALTVLELEMGKWVDAHIPSN